MKAASKRAQLNQRIKESKIQRKSPSASHDEEREKVLTKVSHPLKVCCIWLEANILGLRLRLRARLEEPVASTEEMLPDKRLNLSMCLEGTTLPGERGTALQAGVSLAS